MIVDGRAITHELQEKIKKEAAGKRLALAVVFVGDDLASEKFIARKKKFGEVVGVSVEIFSFPADADENLVRTEIVRLAEDPSVDGVIIQLPLPLHYDTPALLNLIPPEKDVDALSAHPRVLSPVVGAIKEILARHGVSLMGAHVVVVGRGALVGKPVAAWAEGEGADVKSVDKETEDIARYTREADILITGAGVPGLVTPGMVKDGAILIDAGTSESQGKLVGDIDPLCADKAALFTPVPGGVGPITVAMLFFNLMQIHAES